jgi:hypothetical protein
MDVQVEVFRTFRNPETACTCLSLLCWFQPHLSAVLNKIKSFFQICTRNGCRNAGRSGRAAYGVGLRLFSCWGRGFESHRGYGCLFWVSCVLLGRGLYDELITRPEESYRLRCVVVYGVEKQTLWMRRPRPTRGLSHRERKKKFVGIKFRAKFVFYFSVWQR